MKGKDCKPLSWFGKVALVVNLFFVAALLLAYMATYIDPVSFSYLPFFGLFYPVSLFSNLFFIVFWLLGRRKYFLISFVVILIGFSHLSHFVQFSFIGHGIESKEKELNVMSYNVRLFDLYNWTQNKYTRNEIFKFLEEEDPDIICFQEFYHQHPSRSWNFPTRDTLTKILQAKYYAEGYTVNVSHSQFFGLATFSKYPIVNSGHLRFENDHNNSFLFSDIKVEEDTIRVYNAHIGSARFSQADYGAIGTEGNFKTWPHQENNENSQIVARLANAYVKRSIQTQQLLSHSTQSPFPVIISGDFNDTPVSYNYNCLTQQYIDAFTQSANGTGGTYCPIPLLRIDYILHSDFFNSYGFTTHQQTLSDHKAISTIIEF